MKKIISIVIVKIHKIGEGSEICNYAFIDNVLNERRYQDLDRLALILVIIGALNWLLVGLFQFDLVAAIFGGQDELLSRFVYTLVGLAGIWCISLLFREREKVDNQNRNRT